MEYGYINDGGYLVSRHIEELQEQYRDTDGGIKSRTITVEEQIEKLSANGWKPVEQLDESRLQCEDMLCASCHTMQETGLLIITKLYLILKRCDEKSKS